VRPRSAPCPRSAGGGSWTGPTPGRRNQQVKNNFQQAKNNFQQVKNNFLQVKNNFYFILFFPLDYRVFS
jgi:hypothetical protein